jgi:ABC-type nitrate/sulfonate/bicarbonate transport system substrate-binding protein
LSFVLDKASRLDHFCPVHRASSSHGSALGAAPLARALRGAVACALLLVASLSSACSRSKAEQARASSHGYETLELRFEGFSGIVGFPELAQDLGYLAPLKLVYVGSTIGGPHSIQSVVTGDTDFGGAFNGAVIKLVAAKAPIVSVISYYGSD